MACVIEIRDQELYVMVASKSKGHIKVSKSFKMTLKDPLFQNNEVMISEDLIKEIKQVFKQENFTEKKVKLVLNHRVALTKDLVVPKTDKKRLGFLVENEMTSLFNLTRDFIVDYTVIEEIEEEGIKKYKVMACALRRSTISAMESLFSLLGMKIQSVDVAPIVFKNFMHKMGVIDSIEPTIIIDASTSYIRYYLYNNYSFILTRSLYIDIDDDHTTISKRVLHVLELMAQSQRSFTGKDLSRVKLLGHQQRFSMMSALSETYLNMQAVVPNIFGQVSPIDKELYDFGNCMGVLL